MEFSYINKRFFVLVILSVSFLSFISAQSKNAIDSLLTNVCKVSDSRYIIKDESALKISDYQDNILNVLSVFFTNNSKTAVYSKCLNRKLTKGEVAIILCDRIEIMPYFELLGMQNFGFTFCKDNPNFIESYLNNIKKQSTKKFQEKYVQWLNSEERASTKISNF